MPFDTRDANRKREAPRDQGSSPATATARWRTPSPAFSKLPLAKSVVRRFADMEVFVEVQENMRGEDVYVLQSTSFPANDNLMELLILVDALKRSMARRITARHALLRLRPAGSQAGSAHAHLGQARRQPDRARRRRPGHDRRSARRPDPGLLRHPDRQPVRRPGDGARHPGALRHSNLVVVSPDVGGVVRARGLAKRINVPIAICDKRREKAGESEVMNVIGDVEGQALPS